MSNIRGPKERIERALGVKLGLKAERGSSPKSAVLRKPYKPGQHGPGGKRRKSSLSDYGLQLREKQKIKYTYGLSEKQLKEVFRKSIKSVIGTREKLIDILERRLDNVVFRIGFAPSRIVARKMIIDRHITVNNKKNSYPNYQVKVKDIIGISPTSKEKGPFNKLPEILKKYDAPIWLSLDPSKMEGVVSSKPAEVDLPFDYNLIVEFYSR